MTLKFDNNEILVINDTLFLSHIGSESTDEMRYVEIFEDGEVSKTLLRVPYPYSLENARWWIDFTRQQYIDIGVHFNYAIRRKCDQNMNLLIGGIGINNIDSSSHSAEIGYWLDKSEWGQGLMPTIILYFCKFIKKEKINCVLPFSSISVLTAEIFSQNERSRKVLIKCGFKFDIHIPQAYEKYGNFIDADRYVLALDDVL